MDFWHRYHSKHRDHSKFLIVIDHHKQSFSSQKALNQFSLIFKLKIFLKSHRRRCRRRRRRCRHRFDQQCFWVAMFSYLLNNFYKIKILVFFNFYQCTFVWLLPNFYLLINFCEYGPKNDPNFDRPKMNLILTGLKCFGVIFTKI